MQGDFHNCQFKTEIIGLIRESGEQTELLRTVNKTVEALSEQVGKAVTGVNEYREMKQRVIFLASTAAFIVAAGVQLFLFLFHNFSMIVKMFA